KPYQSMLRGERAYQLPETRADLGSDWRDVAAETIRGNPEALDEKHKNLIMRAQLAANRSPLAALGFDPNRVVYYVKEKDAQATSGAYNPKRDVVYANPSVGADVAVHESIHRGLEKLLKNDMLPKDMQDWINRSVRYQTPSGKMAETDMDELLTRYLMVKAMGNPERNPDSPLGNAQIDTALHVFSKPENLSYVMELERIA